MSENPVNVKVRQLNSCGMVHDAAFNKKENLWIGLDILSKKLTFAALIILLITYIVLRNF